IGTDTSPVVVSSLISGRTRRLRWFASIIVGVKERLTPKVLNSTVIVGKPPVAAEEPLIGTGNCPPAVKLAVWPDIAVRFGSARLVMNPSSVRAWIVAMAPVPCPARRKLAVSPAIDTGLKVAKLR